MANRYTKRNTTQREDEMVASCYRKIQNLWLKLYDIDKDGSGLTDEAKKKQYFLDVAHSMLRAYVNSDQYTVEEARDIMLRGQY